MKDEFSPRMKRFCLKGRMAAMMMVLALLMNLLCPVAGAE